MSQLRVSALLIAAAAATLFTACAAESACGGALDSDAGTIHYYDDVDAFGDRACVWIIRLHSTANLSVTADGVAEGTSIGVFTTEQASSTFPVVPPLFVFNASTVGATFRSQFSTVILVLDPAGFNAGRDFTVSWRGEAAGSGLAPIESANYIDADHGTVQQDDGGLAVLALVLNPPQGDKVDLEISVLGHEEDCANLAYSVFELSGGFLREVARTCGRPVALSSIRTPLIAFVAKQTVQQSETISFGWRAINAPDDSSAPCGGSLQSNQGALVYEDAGDASHACTWTLRLQSRSGFRLRLIDINGNTGLGVFSSQQAGSPFPVIEPAHSLNSSDIDSPFDTNGEIIILILKPALVARRFSIAWEGLQDAPTGSPESTSYLDSSEGSLVQDDAQHLLLAFVLNPPQEYPLEVEIKVLGFEESCANLAYSVFEVNEAGNLREVARTCGRPVNLHNVHPPLVAFVAKAQATQSERVSLTWNSVRPPVDDGSSTTPDPSLVISTECGGVLVGASGVIRYKIQTPYVRNERCVWTIRADLFSQVRLQMVDDGLYTVPGFDFLTLSTIPNIDSQQIISTDQIINGGFRSPVTLRGPIVFVTFRTAQGGSRGFELHFEGLGTSIPNRRFSHLHYNASLEATEPFRYPEQGNYDDNELVTLVFNQGLLNLQYQLNLLLNYVDLENQASCSYDVLSINEADGAGNYLHHQRICPVTSTIDRNYAATAEGGTFVLIFKTDGSVTRSGFRGLFSYLRI